jgi:tetratricopeptide (TPR) repeat protein
MKFPFHWLCGVLLLAGLGLGGCLPVAQSQSDEEREPHYLTGKGRAEAMDYPGAIEAFEKALEVNPQSAAAHFELGWLFDQKEADPAAAIYHYDRYLKLRPNAGNAETIKARILGCKQDLARTVSLAPVTKEQQRQFEQLAEENKRLTEENKRQREELEKWRAAYAARGLSLTNRSGPTAQAPRSGPASGVTPEAPSGTAEVTAIARQTLVPAPGGRSYTVKPGETPVLIARKYGIKLEALMAANPGLNSRHMRVGQVLSIPAGK